jgi:hypothetical protein
MNAPNSGRDINTSSSSYFDETNEIRGWQTEIIKSCVRAGAQQWSNFLFIEKRIYEWEFSKSVQAR